MPGGDRYHRGMRKASRDDGNDANRLLHAAWKPDRIDGTDLAVIEQLQANGRASFKSIADVVGISETAVRKRVNRLIDEGMIQIVAVLNSLSARGIVMAMAQLKVGGDVDVVSEKITGWPECSWVAVGAGRFDVLAELVCDGREALLDVFRRLHNLEGVREVEMFFYLKVHKQLYVGPLLS